MSTRKATLVLQDPPVLRPGPVSLAYVVDRGERGRDTCLVDANLADDLRPISKADALGAAAIYDACDGWVKQVLRAEFATYTARVKAHNIALKTAVEAGQGGEVVRLMQDKPIRPDVSDETAERIAPFVRFMQAATSAWAGARKHTLAIFGSGKYGREIIWTGTLSALTGKRPASGTIALGRRVK